MVVGGLFLIAKSAHEIYEKVELEEGEEEEDDELRRPGQASLVGIVLQIAVMDIIFSLDSVITAVGMANDVPVMVAAIMVAVGIMLLFARHVGEFVNRHPSMKLLALSFLMLIGVLLVAEGFDQHISKGYVYAAMGFALFVELLNMRLARRRREARAQARAVAVEVSNASGED